MRERLESRVSLFPIHESEIGVGVEVVVVVEAKVKSERAQSVYRQHWRGDPVLPNRWKLVSQISVARVQSDSGLTVEYDEERAWFLFTIFPIRESDFVQSRKWKSQLSLPSALTRRELVWVWRSHFAQSVKVRKSKSPIRLVRLLCQSRKWKWISLPSALTRREHVESHVFVKSAQDWAWSALTRRSSFSIVWFGKSVKVKSA